MGRNQRQDLLSALKLELKFCELGGYKPARGRFPARASENDPISTFLFHESTPKSRKELFVFRDSPSCLNYGLPVREHPCSECWLMAFVPAERRGEAVPCHHIRLNERGETVANLGDRGTHRTFRKPCSIGFAGQLNSSKSHPRNRKSQRRKEYCGACRKGFVASTQQHR